LNNEAVLTVPGSHYQIEMASWRDLSSIRDLESICFPRDAWPLLDMIGVLSLPQVVRYKVEDRGQVIGFVAGDIRRMQHLGWIATICVHPDYRGMGIGRALLSLCEEKMGMPKVKLTVRQTNYAAIDLYRRQGYIETGQWKRYYKGGENAVVMEKVLGDIN